VLEDLRDCQGQTEGLHPGVNTTDTLTSAELTALIPAGYMLLMPYGEDLATQVTK
jgi:hypothetical protein